MINGFQTILTCFLNKSAWAASAWSAAAMKPITSSTDHSAGGAPGAGGGGAPVVDDAGSGRSGDIRAILAPDASPVPFTLLPAPSSCKNLFSFNGSKNFIKKNHIIFKYIPILPPWTTLYLTHIVNSLHCSEIVRSGFATYCAGPTSSLTRINLYHSNTAANSTTHSFKPVL